MNEANNCKKSTVQGACIIKFIVYNDDGDKVGEGVGRALEAEETGIVLVTKEKITSGYIFMAIENDGAENIGKVIGMNTLGNKTHHIHVSFRGNIEDNNKFINTLLLSGSQDNFLQDKEVNTKDSNCLNCNDSSSEKNLKGIKVTYQDEVPMQWAKGKPGWVTLHDYELFTLKVLIKSTKKAKLKEYDIPVTTKGRTQKYYRLLVPDLYVAFEIIRFSRITKEIYH